MKTTKWKPLKQINNNSQLGTYLVYYDFKLNFQQHPVSWLEMNRLFIHPPTHLFIIFRILNVIKYPNPR